MAKRLHRIGIIGCGWFAPFHLAALDALRHRETVVWAADPDFERANAVANQAAAKPLTD